MPNKHKCHFRNVNICMILHCVLHESVLFCRFTVRWSQTVQRLSIQFRDLLRPPSTMTRICWMHFWMEIVAYICRRIIFLLWQFLDFCILFVSALWDSIIYCNCIDFNYKCSWMAVLNENRWLHIIVRLFLLSQILNFCILFVCIVSWYYELWSN